ncbi:hypothetical protein BH09ACT12_BH09ACT12_00440 [soil metagenome]
MARFSTTPRTTPAQTPRGEIVAQVLTGIVLGVGAVYVGAVMRRGPVVALVVLLIGASYLLRNWHRVKWVARGFLASGLTALGAVLLILLLGHDVV